MTRPHALRHLALAALGLCLAAAPAAGLIDPNYTPADLVNDADVVYEVRAAAPNENGLVKARVAETVKGNPPADGQLVLDSAELDEVPWQMLQAAFGDARTVRAVFFASKDAKTGRMTGGIQVDTEWFAVAETEEGWALEQAEKLPLVWAGSARQLVRAARAVVADAGVRFPVASALTWRGGAKLGKLAGTVHGCTVVDFGGEVGRCVLFLASGGDRAYALPTEKGARPVDVTDRLKPATSSRRAAPGDFNADGRIDLAAWDGKTLRLVLADEAGRLAHAASAELKACTSLAAVRAEGGPGIVAGTPSGPVLFTLAGAKLTTRDLVPADAREAVDALGRGGPCVVADIDADGRTDILQVLAKGIALYRGEKAGRWAAPETIVLSLPADPVDAVPGDYDQDGRLDVYVLGSDGMGLVSRGGEGAWLATIHETGELIRHGGGGRPVTADAADINADGRQGVALFYAGGLPAVFFNRGFACFGLARKLMLTEYDLDAAKALGRGQAAGVILDTSGDDVQDLLAAAPGGEVWALWGKIDGLPPVALTVALPPKAAGPVTLTVKTGGRARSVVLVQPGRPAVIARSRRGPVELEWVGPDGKTHTRRVVLVRSMSVTLGG